MKDGLFLRIPQSAVDAERLWAQAAPLDDSNRPQWLSSEKWASYRFGGSTPSSVSADQASRLAEELSQFESAGGIVDESPGPSGARRVYVPRPWWDQVWSIGMYEGESPLEMKPHPGATNPVLTRDHVTDIPAVFVADPFLCRSGDNWNLFFEVMNWANGRGEIALATSADAVHWKYQRVVLAEPFHLSYPYVFQWENAWYMIPESYQAKEVRLYQATHFPNEWSPVATLLAGDYLVDSSPFRHGDAWWMFVDASANAAHDTLRLFRSDQLTGPWREHPANPLISRDRTRARPAGRIITDGGRVLRFAQNCRPAYGTQVRAFEITRLTPDEYQERPVGPDPLLGPSGSGWNADGMHQIDAHRIPDGRWIAAVDGWFATPNVES